MKREGKRAGYAAVQIALHWAIALLVLFQLLSGGTMTEAGNIFAAGGTPTPFQNNVSNAHYWIGISILALVLVRLVVRIALGAPQPAAGTARWMVVAANGVHHLFYLLLIVTPLLGLAGYYYGDPYADIHAAAKPVFILLIVGHAGAAIFHQFWLKDGTLRRMFVPA